MVSLTMSPMNKTRLVLLATVMLLGAAVDPAAACDWRHYCVAP